MGIFINTNYISWTLIDTINKKIINSEKILINRKKSNKNIRIYNNINALENLIYNYLNIDISAILQLYNSYSKEYLWSLRLKGLTEKITNLDLSIILLDVFYHRGSDIKNIQIDITLSEYILKNGLANKGKKISRDLIFAELIEIFNKQNQLGNNFVNDDFIQKYFSLLIKEKEPSKQNNNNDFLIGKLVSLTDCLNQEYYLNRIHISFDCFYNNSNPIDNKDTLKKELTELLGPDFSRDILLRYALFKEEKGISPYSLKELSLNDALDPSITEIDHIIPKSLSKDNSFTNKVLVYIDENRDKGNRTPYQFIGANENEWSKFESWVNNSNLSYAKKRNLLNTNSIEKNIKFHSKEVSKILKHFKIELSKKDYSKNILLKYCLNSDYLSFLKDLLLSNNFNNICEEKILSFISSIVCTHLYTLKFKNNNFNNSYILKSTIHRCFPMEMKKELESKLYLFNKESNPVYIYKDLTDLSKDDLDFICKDHLNKKLYEFILLRMEQFEYDAKKAFNTPLFMPSKKGNGQIVQKIKLKYE